MPEITVTKIAGAIGAEIGGVDLRRELSDDTIAEIRRLWNEHVVIFFRDQALERPLPSALASRWSIRLSAASRAFP